MIIMSNQRSYLSRCLLFLSLVVRVQSTDCFPPSTWPKLIGYGIEDQFVYAIDRCGANSSSSYGRIVLNIFASEANLVGNITPAASGNHSPVVISVFDPATEQYEWVSVLQRANKNSYISKYTPDCSKIFLMFMISDTVALYPAGYS